MGQSPRVVVFSGGRGAVTILRALLQQKLPTTVLVNGYDDGLSTGLIRRMVPEMLGPSDFRKLSETLGTPPDEPYARMRLPLIDAMRQGLHGVTGPEVSELYARMRTLQLDPEADMSVGNVRFAYEFLRHNKSFQGAVDAYALLCACRLPLVAVSGYPGQLMGWTRTGGLLRSEAEIVDSPWAVANIALGPVAAPVPEPRAIEAVLQATHILYAPGTFPSSIWPSIRVMRRVLRATWAKHHVLVTNATHDGGMHGWNVEDYINAVRGEDVPLTNVFHDSRSRIRGVDSSTSRIPVLIRKFLNDNLQQHNGDAVIEALLCLR